MLRLRSGCIAGALSVVGRPGSVRAAAGPGTTGPGSGRHRRTAVGATSHPVADAAPDLPDRGQSTPRGVGRPDPGTDAGRRSTGSRPELSRGSGRFPPHRAGRTGRRNGAGDRPEPPAAFRADGRNAECAGTRGRTRFPAAVAGGGVAPSERADRGGPPLAHRGRSVRLPRHPRRLAPFQSGTTGSCGRSFGSGEGALARRLARGRSRSLRLPGRSERIETGRGERSRSGPAAGDGSRPHRPRLSDQGQRVGRLGLPGGLLAAPCAESRRRSVLADCRRGRVPDGTVPAGAGAVAALPAPRGRRPAGACVRPGGGW